MGHRADGGGGEGEDADEKTDGDAPAVDGDATRFPVAGEQLEPLEGVSQIRNHRDGHRERRAGREEERGW